MNRKLAQDYTTRHQQIRSKLQQMSARCQCGCFSVSKIAAELGMDQRTIRAHLKIIELDKGGVFLDPKEKEFCTQEGLNLLAERLDQGKTTDNPPAD